MDQRQQLRWWFDQIDLNRSGELDARELQQALALGGLVFGLSDVDQMIRAFDTTSSRGLSFGEFERLHSFLLNVQASFKTFDVDGNNKLCAQEVVQALMKAGFHLDHPAVVAMIHKFDTDNGGDLSLDEYIRSCLFLQTALRTFAAFDTQREGSVALNFSQFVYACSHVCG